jgi:uncharacterized protein (DUF1800 family)
LRQCLGKLGRRHTAKCCAPSCWIPAYITTVEYQRNKAKTPFEYAVSIARALGAVPSGDQVDNFYRDIREIIRNAGEAYLEFQVPTGLPEVAAAWTSSATMINAYNEAMDITERRHLYGIDWVPTSLMQA